MEIGEIIGIFFLLGLLFIFGAYIYRTKCCPECGAFRSIERVEAEYTAIDNETDGFDVIKHLLSEGAYRTNGSTVKWTDRCRKCGYESKGEHSFRHY